MEDDDDNEFFTEDFERYFTESDEHDERPTPINQAMYDAGHKASDFS